MSFIPIGDNLLIAKMFCPETQEYEIRSASYSDWQRVSNDDKIDKNTIKFRYNIRDGTYNIRYKFKVFYCDDDCVIYKKNK